MHRHSWSVFWFRYENPEIIQIDVADAIVTEVDEWAGREKLEIRDLETKILS